MTKLAPLFFIVLLSISAALAKECITLSRGKDLKQHLESSSVLVVLGDDEDEVYKELCERLANTPETRVQALEIALVETDQLKKHVLSKAVPSKLGIWEHISRFVAPKQKDVAPADETSRSDGDFVLYRKGESAGVLYSGEEEKTADGISQFVSRTLNIKKIGNFVYSLGSFDLIASQLMSSSETWQQQFWGLGVNKAVTMLHWSQFQSDFEAELLQQYIKIGQKVQTEGKDYPQKQVERLEKMLNNPDAKISDMQKEKLSQKIYTLKRFVEPVQVEKEEVQMFLAKLGLNILTLLMMVILIPLLFFSSDDEGEDEEEDEEEDKALAQAEEELMEEPDQEEDIEDDEDVVEEDEPTEDAEQQLEEDEEPAAVVEEKKKLTKQEKRQLAIDRARQAMHADKQRVQAVKKKYDAAASAEEPAPSSSDFDQASLSEMKVTELKERLRDRGLKVSGNKAELIARLLVGGD